MPVATPSLVAGKAEREDHHGGKVARLHDVQLVHQLAVVGPDGGDDPRVLPCLLLEHVEQLGQLARPDVVEIRVAAVEQRAHAALLEVLDQRAIVGRADREIAVARERRHGDDGGGEVGGGDGGGFHETTVNGLR